MRIVTEYIFNIIHEVALFKRYSGFIKIKIK